MMLNLKPIFAILGGFLIHLTLGAVYSWGNLSLYVISYIRNNGSPSIGKNISVWPFALSLFGQSIFMPFGGLIERKFGAKITMAIGCSILCVSLFLTSAVCHNFVGLILIYGLLAGSGAGIAYSSPMSVCMKWLPKYKGLINGIIVGGFGLGSFVFSQIQLAIINPNKESPSDDGYYTKEQVKNVPKLFLVTGGIYICLELIGWLMITLPDKETSEKIEKSMIESIKKSKENVENSRKDDSIVILSPKSEIENENENVLPISIPLTIEKEKSMPNELNSSIESEKSSSTNDSLDNNNNNEIVKNEIMININVKSDEINKLQNKKEENENNNNEQIENHIFTVKEALKTYQFWIIWLMFMGNGVAVSIMSSYWKVQGIDEVTNDDTFLTWTGSISSIFNAAGRIVWGELGDIIGQKITCGILGIICGVCQFSFYYIRSKVLYAIYVCLSFFCFGGFFGLYPTMTAVAFKRKNFSIIYGCIFTSQIVSNLFSAVFSQILLESIGLLGIFVMVGSFVSFSLILVLFYPSKSKRIKKENDLSKTFNK